MRTQQTSEWGHSEISIDSLPQVWFGWSLSEEPSTCKARAVRKTDWARSDLETGIPLLSEVHYVLITRL